MSEEEFGRLMAEMATGNKDALRDIYVAYNKIIFNIILGEVKRREVAEDLTSDFFIKLYNNAKAFKNNGHHKAWIITIAKNMCIDYLRKANREVLSLDADINDEDDKKTASTGAAKSISSDDGNTYYEPAVKSHEEKVVNKLTLEDAMKVLNEKEKEIIDMKVAMGITFREIAEMLEMPIGTVTWYYNSGIKKLRRHLKNE